MDLQKSLKHNENDINRKSCLIAFALLMASIIMFLMNKSGIFILNSDDSIIVVVLVGILTVIDFFMVFILKLQQAWVKYVITVIDCIIVGILYSFLSMHTVLVLCVPLIKSCLYFDRKVSMVAGIVSSFAMFIAHVVSVRLSIVPDDPIVKSYLAALVFGFLPRYIEFCLINLTVALLTRNTSNMFDDLCNYEEINKALAEVEEAKLQLEHNQSVMQALGEEYLTVLFLDLDKGVIRTEKAEEFILFSNDKDNSQGEFSFENIVNSSLNQYVHPDDRQMFLDSLSRESIQKILDTQKSLVFRFNCLGPDNTYYCVEMHIVPSREQHHNNSVVIGLRNINDQVKKEKEQMDAMEKAMLEAKRANAAKTSFLSRMSHDIRTPLNGIIGLFEIDSKHPDDIELWRENRKKSTVAANHLLSLINDVLDMSKLEDGTTVLAHEGFDIFEMTAETLTIVKMRAADAGITMEYAGGEIEVPYRYVYGSPLHIKQIFLNIYGNSIKYNKPGGKIVTKVSINRLDDTHLRFMCTISDTGIGMRPEFLEHLFEPFTQERIDARSVYQGTGLGMSIVKSLIDKMNGTIDVTSEVNVGSTFVISIPLEVADENDVESKIQKNVEADISGVKILLVEDNELNMDIAVTLLEEMNASVTTAVNGREAVDIFNSNPEGTFDVILMDIMMPVLDGIAATKEIRSLERPDSKTIPIIAMTANAFAEDVQNVKNAGMNDHIAKPIDIALIAQKISYYVK